MLNHQYKPPSPTGMEVDVQPQCFTGCTYISWTSILGSVKSEFFTGVDKCNYIHVYSYSWELSKSPFNLTWYQLGVLCPKNGSGYSKNLVWNTPKMTLWLILFQMGLFSSDYADPGMWKHVNVFPCCLVSFAGCLYIHRPSSNARQWEHLKIGFPKHADHDETWLRLSSRYVSIRKCKVIFYDLSNHFCYDLLWSMFTFTISTSPNGAVLFNPIPSRSSLTSPCNSTALRRWRCESSEFYPGGDR